MRTNVCRLLQAKNTISSSLCSVWEGGMSCRILLRRRPHVSPYITCSRSLGSFMRFQDYLNSRRVQASKSLLIQIANPESAQEVGQYLRTNFGPLDAIYHYTVPKKTKGGSGASGFSQITGAWLSNKGEHYHWLLAQFTSCESVTECLKDCNHPENTIPCNLRMCWIHPNQFNGNGKKSKPKCNASNGSIPLPEIRTESTDGNKEINNGGKSLNDQLKILEDSTKLSELGIRLRFFLASQLEQSFQTFFPLGCVLPFGSTVSGIGRHSGDLDLVMVPDSREIFPEEATNPGKDNNKKPLYFHAKISTASNSSNARFQAQRVMEVMADVIQLFVPGCNNVQRILQARIPILRFWSEYTDLQCDLSMTNSSGVYMSELIYLMSKIEPRFSTLLFAIRSWAAARKITNPVPGRQPTNFMLVLLLIYYLQRKQLLPTLDIMFNNAETRDQRTTIDGIDCSFIRDKDRILKYFTPNLTRNESIAELLFEFFEFYSEFDFSRKGVSLITGSSWGKPDAGPLYIQNPLERHLNVARNVSKEEIVRFKSKSKELMYMGKGMMSFFHKTSTPHVRLMIWLRLIKNNYLDECCSALWKLETSWHSLDSVEESKGKGGEVSLKDVLLSPTLDGKAGSHTDMRLRMKELFTK